MANPKKRIPMQHVIGFLLSIAMTLLAVWAALDSNLPTLWVIVSIFTLAILQAGVQLFMFMHMTEKASGGGHVPWNMMFHGFALAAIIVAGSLFTMSFGFSDDMDHKQEQQKEENVDNGG